MFNNYASDPEVARYMSWPRHVSINDSREFIDFAISEWEQGDSGTYLIADKNTGDVIGSTGLMRDNPVKATTGYVLSRESWGRGYATETLMSIVNLASRSNIMRLYAYCHHDHQRSARVMEKCTFQFEGIMHNYMEFPNLSPGEVSDVLLYAWIPADNS